MNSTIAAGKPSAATAASPRTEGKEAIEGSYRQKNGSPARIREIAEALRRLSGQKR